jgi:hypothetical protein
MNLARWLNLAIITIQVANHSRTVPRWGKIGPLRPHPVPPEPLCCFETVGNDVLGECGPSFACLSAEKGATSLLPLNPTTATSAVDASLADGASCPAQRCVTVANFPALPPGQQEVRQFHLPGGLVADFGGKATTMRFCWGPKPDGSGRNYCAEFDPSFVVREPFVCEGGVWDAAKSVGNLFLNYEVQRICRHNGRTLVLGDAVMPQGGRYSLPQELPERPLRQVVPQLGRTLWDLTKARFPGVFHR